MNCDKYAQPVELGENWLGAYVMVDMKLFMVVMLILLAPFLQSSVRARLSLTSSLTFQ